MTSTSKPEFVDNRDGNTLSEALKSHLDWLDTNYVNPTQLFISTGYFNPEGYEMLADRLDRIEKTKLLIGAEPAPPHLTPRYRYESSEKESNSSNINEALKALSEGLSHDRDLLGFSALVDMNLERLIEFLSTDKVEVRRYEKGFLHGKAFIFDDEGLLSGSSNFTRAGLSSNLELNLGRYDPTPVSQVKQWFEDLWEESQEFDLADIYKTRYQEYSPYLIYLKVLWELYKNELTQDQDISGNIPLTTFQNDGIKRAKHIIEKYNGVLISDGVGLGKTFIGGELIREAVQEHRQRALLICPAALRDGTWQRFQDIYQIYMECISFEQFASHVEYIKTGKGTRHLNANLNDYSLVVIDEAQAFRNPGIDRASALRSLLQGSPTKKLMLMSATPVNNSLWDLYYLLSYFIKQDAAFANKGIVSLRSHFSEGQAQDPTQLRPDHLFDVLDEVVVRRTRNFVKKYYPNDKINGPDGIPVTIQFPKPHVNRIDYDLEAMLPGLLDDFESKVMPETGDPDLTLARYSPDQYKTGSNTGPEPGMIGLIRSSLLKRLESSPHAFTKTLEKMIYDHEVFLEGVESGWILTTDQIHHWQETDNDESLELLTEGQDKGSINDYDTSALKNAVKKDLNILKEFRSVSELVDRHSDTKLASLVRALKDLVKRASNKSIEDNDNHKVIIFSYFADTVEWIVDHLSKVIETDSELKVFKNRLVSITGNKTNIGVSREQAIFGFAPQSTEAPEGSDEDKFDILVTTDVLAEGQNLQQCGNLMNYDLPWNPMRLVQRHGRIDRIGSPHDDVYIGCVFPDKDLERLLTLEDRIKNKLAQAAASIGIESEVIPGGATGEIIFSQDIKTIESIRQGDTSLFENGGEEINAHSGEEYRQELRKGLETQSDQISNLPWGIGSGFASGMQTGHFFCSRVKDKTYLRFVPLDDENIVSNTLECLRRISSNQETVRYISDDLLQSVYKSWDRAKESIYEDWQHLTDPANLQPRIRPLFRNIADHIRDHPPTDTTQEKIDQIIDSLEAPWGLRIEKELRIVFNNPDHKGKELSNQIIAKVDELALEPFESPDPLPPIGLKDIHLVCWMAVTSDQG